ncbi:MAG: hypothetical protein HZB36_06905 [Candidatus Omnitrophica bacterium]|nr:hypothetical protein [Candidatus Omnitrophota bacterium]
MQQVDEVKVHMLTRGGLTVGRVYGGNSRSDVGTNCQKSAEAIVSWTFKKKQEKG